MNTTNLTNLDIVTLYIVKKTGKIGLYHYNKLTYLFEFFFIKNFGSRFTKEYFIKLPHGPAIANYKNQITKLTQYGYYDIDLKLLKHRRQVDDYLYRKILIQSGSRLDGFEFPIKYVQKLIDQIVEKYATMTVAQLEKVVYKTKPLIMYQKKVKQGFKNKTGGYILKGDCLKISEHKNSMTEGRKLALEHIKKYPKIDFEQQAKLLKEFEFLEKLRPQV